MVGWIMLKINREGSMDCEASKDTQQPPAVPESDDAQPLEDRPPVSRRSRSTSLLDGCLSILTEDLDSLEKVKEALELAGLPSSSVILGIDFTGCNNHLGTMSWRNLHEVGHAHNPYQQAISILGKSLPAFHDKIMCFGFDESSLRHKDVFAFHRGGLCDGFEDVLNQYEKTRRRLCLKGKDICATMSFVPIINKAISIVANNRDRYHVLVVIASQEVDIDNEQLTDENLDVILKASELPLSIILVGVGDGPWNIMDFNDIIPCRKFDNFQFVNFSEIMSKRESRTRKEAAFALAALMPIPGQYETAKKLGLLGCSQDSSEPTTPSAPPMPPTDENKA